MAKPTSLKKIIGVPLQKGIRKTDEGHVFVNGKFTSDQLDEIGDIITRGATERAIPKYRQWGNIRYMHLPKPVGKVVRIGAEDGLEWNEVEIKVIDPEAAYQVEHGLLTALSVGILVKWEDLEFDEETEGFIINNYTLVEISLVDHPANYDAKLDFAALPEEFRDIARTQGVYEAIKLFGVETAAPEVEEIRAEAEAEVTTEEPVEEAPAEEVAVEADAEPEQTEEIETNLTRSPECRQEGESEEDCVSRKIPEIMEDDPSIDQEQAAAIAYSMCEEACGEGSSDEEESLPVAEEVEEEQPVEEDPIEELQEAIAQELGIDALVEKLDIYAEKIIMVLREALAPISEQLSALSKRLEIQDTENIEPQEQEPEEITDEEVVTLRTQVANLEEELKTLTATLEDLRKPGNRTSAVRNLDPVEGEETSEEEEEAPKPKNLKEGLRMHFQQRNLYK